MNELFRLNPLPFLQGTTVQVRNDKNHEWVERQFIGRNDHGLIEVLNEIGKVEEWKFIKK